MQVILNFQHQLHSLIPLYVELIFLRVLESPNSTPLWKLSVLKCFKTLLSKPQKLVELFVA